MRKMFKIGILVLVLAGLAGGAAWWWWGNGEGDLPSLNTVAAKKGELVVFISATGTVEPEEVVDVGARVAGEIITFGKDAGGNPVDYGSPVKQGTVLARIDDSLYLADLAQAEATVQSAQAGLERAQADREQARAKLRQSERDWLRAQKLGPSEALSQASYDAYRSAFETSQAAVAVSQAAIGQARAAIAQAEASLTRAKRSLAYCTIVSPVKGIIIDRRVNIGQTVVASLNAPSLFLIAKDLKRIQVWVAVNEADIGKIHPGQPVSFTVDAFPGEKFQGQVGKVRLNASMTQNVVTYTVEIVTDNSNGRLLPYLSANVKFEVQRIKDALLVPNAALRWRPTAQLVAPVPSGAQESQASSGPGTSARPRASSGGQGRGVVWVPDQGGLVRALPVKVLASDGLNTAITARDLKVGMEVVAGLQTESVRKDAANNPFLPKFPGRSKRPR